MREIKFRGKERTGEWITGGYVQKNGAPHIMAHIVDRGVDEWRAIPVIPATVGQFTGLRDAKGVEIYEGDVLLYREMNRRAGVSWCDGGFIVYDVNDPDEWQALNDDDASQVISQIMEVINNVHDAPELLGGTPSC